MPVARKSGKFLTDSVKFGEPMDALDRRIVQAAIEVCGDASNVNLEGKNAVRQCRDDTIAQAASQREQLLAAARSGSPIIVASAR